MSSVKKTIGWRCWYDDGSVEVGTTFDDWARLGVNKPKNCLIKIIYYSDETKQVQTMDWWYEVAHEDGVIRATCTDAKKADIVALHHMAVFIEGFWTSDDWFHSLLETAMTSVWNDGN